MTFTVNFTSAIAISSGLVKDGVWFYVTEPNFFVDRDDLSIQPGYKIRKTLPP